MQAKEFLYKLIPRLQLGQHVTERQTHATVSLPPIMNLVVVPLEMVMQHALPLSRPTIQHAPVA
jgi:hypothetical protein